MESLVQSPEIISRGLSRTQTVIEKSRVMILVFGFGLRSFIDCIAATKGATRCFQFNLVTCVASVLRSDD